MSTPTPSANDNAARLPQPTNPCAQCGIAMSHAWSFRYCDACRIAPTTPPRTEGAADGLRECVRAAIRDKHYNERIGFDSAHLADAAIAAVRAYDAAHPPQLAPQPVPVVATGAEPAYECRCCLCYAGFIGSKRAVVCPTCIRVAAERRATMAAPAPGAPAAQATVPAGGVGACEVCWTNSWQPTETGLRCLCCWQKERLEALTVPARTAKGGRDLATDLVAAAESCAIGSWEDAGTTASRIAAHLTRLGYGLGGGLSKEARETSMEALDFRERYTSPHLYPHLRQAIDRARAEIEAVARVGVRT